jgi:hypothetical protein
MRSGELFARAVTVLPNSVRERLDGDVPLDWTLLEDAATGAGLEEAVRKHQRLPASVEVLVRRLILDLGIAPDDLARGEEREGSSGAWINWVTLEAEAGSYQLRNERSGRVHCGVRPEALAGYATLGLELAAALHDATERWMDAGARHEQAEGGGTTLAQCAVHMRKFLGGRSEEAPAMRSAARSARILERAWNTQGAETRAALSGVRLSTARGARAPKRNWYAPAMGHRLRAFDSGEIRWLRALAERAATGRLEEAPAASPSLASLDNDAETAGGATRSARSGSGGKGPGPSALALDSRSRGLLPEAEVAELERVANHLPGAVQRRMGESYGAEVAQALARFQNPREVEIVRAEIGRAASGSHEVRWLEGLAAALLEDAGAQTREGRRTGSVRLGPRQEPDGGHRATEVETGAFGNLSPVALVEQIRLSLLFAQDAWTGLMALRSAGKEGDWTLNEAEAGTNELAAGEHETLEAARDIGQALERIQRAFGDAHGERAPTALEQATMAAETLRQVGPTVRTAAGWPGGADAPEARSPEDIARIASVAEALHAEIRSTANRLIAGWIAEVQAYGESRRA